MTQLPEGSRILWTIQFHPLLILSAILAIAYGAFSPWLYAVHAWPYAIAIFKVSSIVFLAAIAAQHKARTLLWALIFGGAGDIGLALGQFETGAAAFLIGHLFYITLFVRSGIGLGALRSPWRLAASAALIGAAIVMTSLLVPRDSPLFIPLCVYTGVLTLMVLSSFTLSAAHWLVMAGAVLFFVSDGFVAWNMFHDDVSPTLAYWRSFAGWMLYWAGQAAICMGAIGLPASRTKGREGPAIPL